MGRLEDSLVSAEELISKSKRVQDDFLAKGHLLMLQGNLEESGERVLSSHALFLLARLTSYQGRKSQEKKTEAFQDNSTDDLYSQVQSALMLYQIRADS